MGVQKCTVNAKQGIKIGASCVAPSPLQSYTYWPKCCLRATEPVQHTNSFARFPCHATCTR